MDANEGTRVDTEDTWLRPRAYFPTRIVAEWWCPVCGREAHRMARPGRPKVYCSNACRQRAYRWRRGRRIDEAAVPAGDAVRGRTHDRSHAMRRASDLTGGKSDSRGREVTLCGAFARRANPRQFTHTRFVPEIPWSCRTCVNLIPP